MQGTNVGSIYFDVTADTAQLVKQSRVVERETQSMAASFNAITRAVKLYAAAMALVKAVELADNLRLLAARVEVAAGSMESGAAAMRELEQISRRTQTSVEANASVFARLNQSLLQMGGTQQDTLQLTELLAKAIKVSGASAMEAKAAMLQFGQALGSGKLAGDELRSLLENAPYLMRQLADGLGVPIGALKQLGEDGKLTADVVVNALTGAAAKIEADFQKFPLTFEAALQQVRDAFTRANEKIDELSGKSIVATGAAQGLAQAIDALVTQLAGVNDEAGKLDRNDTIRQWADKTKMALSYVIDAADLTWQTLSVLGRNVAFVFQGVGTEIGGIGAQIAAVMRGDFAGARAIGDAMKADAEERRRKLDEEDRKTLARTKLFGQQMREAWAMARVEDRGFVPPRPVSKLKPPATTDKSTGAEFDAVGYLLQLEEKTKTAYERIDVIEREALNKADGLRKQGKLSAQQYEQARTLIQTQAAQERAKLDEEAAKESRQRQWDYTAAQDKAEADRKKSRDMAQDMIVGGDEIAKLEIELQRKTELLREAAENDQANAELYAQARVQLEADTLERMRQIQEKNEEQRRKAQTDVLQSYSSLFGSMADVAKDFGGKQSATYRALFAISKAFAIAEAMVNIQAAIAKAANDRFPQNIVAMATVAAQTAGIIATIKGVQFGGGRQYGGPTTAGMLYRVNEAGRPEMFTAANGAQYMMPTANGTVTPADGAGAASRVELQVVVNNNHPTAQVSASRDSQTGQVLIAVNEVASQIVERRGQVWSALRTTNVQGRV